MSVRTASALAVATSVAVLLPLAATTATAAEEPAGKLRTEISAPVPNAPLTRGGAAETFRLTVKNPTSKALPFHPWLLGDPAGPSPLGKKDVVFKVEAVHAPATTSFVGLQDGEWQGVLRPARGSAGQGFKVPAHGELTWKVTIGLGKGYPSNDGDFKLTAAAYSGDVDRAHTGARTFRVGPHIKAGELTNTFVKQPSGQFGATTQFLDVTYRTTGEGAFDRPLATALSVDTPEGVASRRVSVQAFIDGRWQGLKRDGNRFELPVIAKGFGAASGPRTQPVRIALAEGPAGEGWVSLTARTDISLATGTNTYPFNGTETSFKLRNS